MATAKRPIGSKVGRYRLISLLGEGATGAVYLAEAEPAGERVGLKLLDPELGDDERFRRRLLRESEIAASLEHPNVVPVLDYGEADGVLYLAMRFVDGSDLRALLAAAAMRFPAGSIFSTRPFWHTVERTLTGSDSAGLHLMGDIVGARAFNAGQLRDVPGIVAQGNRLSITLVRPAGDLLARLAMPLFCVVPANTPAPGKTHGPIPSAGPYYISSESARETVLDRNPNYRGTRPRRPARIIYLNGIQTARAVALAGGGQVDLVTWDYDSLSPLAPGGALDREFGHDPTAASRDGSPRYHAAPAPGLDMLAFNTRRGLFTDPRLRRAASYALDRNAMAGVFREAPTDGYVPPAVPGAGMRSVYPLTGPDLAAALKLAPPGPRRHASLYDCGDPATLRVADIIRADLEPLRIDVSIVQSFGCLSGVDPKAKRADIVLLTLATQDLDPQPFLEAMVGRTFPFGPTNSPVTYSDRAVVAKLDQIRGLSGGARLAAYASLEDELLRGPAPFAAYGAFVTPEFMSSRVGCRLIQGAYHVVDLAALCLRRS